MMSPEGSFSWTYPSENPEVGNNSSQKGWRIPSWFEDGTHNYEEEVNIEGTKEQLQLSHWLDPTKYLEVVTVTGWQVPVVWDDTYSTAVPGSYYAQRKITGHLTAIQKQHHLSKGPGFTSPPNSVEETAASTSPNPRAKSAPVCLHSQQQAEGLKA
ncbi:N-acetyllactosaminide alpha-1,3-galactosyltransferase [Fukomys damarensis]|uniref:N-acetyllactosaminide alpha-1,3-galactosyltransferase n=1 Tax=Fukomys damarensis TaxID=885580 RepID=A0A091DTV5_FUKDA|nr:N-acetyllactosaminide alpha-1,3-galactosyltransferase [Fukomys damarensis]